jgi:hypothetical protein
MALLNLSISYKTISKLLLLLFFPLVSIYILPSGGFQLVDVVIILVICFTFATVDGHEIEQIAPALIALFVYFAWTIINSLYYFVIVSDVFYVKVIIQNLFAAITFCSFAILFQRLMRSREHLLFVVFALILSIIPVFIVKGSTDLHGTDFNIFGGRGALSFNNPNQLGYYAVLILSILVVAWIYSSQATFKKWTRIAINFFSFLVFGASHFLAAYSASRAAIGAVALLDMLIMVRFRRLILKLIIVAIPLLIIFILSPYGQAITNNRLLNAIFIQRFTQGNIQSNAQERTFGLFMMALPHEASVLFGSGKTIIRANIREVHNALIDVFLSYGFFGLTLFFIFLVTLAIEPIRRRLGFRSLIYLYAIGPIFAYNMFHNGFRVRLMWVFLAFWYVLVICAEPASAEDEQQISDVTMVTS